MAVSLVTLYPYSLASSAFGMMTPIMYLEASTGMNLLAGAGCLFERNLNSWPS